MTNFELARRAIRAYPVTATTDRIYVNRMRRKWMRAVRRLGDKWIALPRPCNVVELKRTIMTLHEIADLGL